MNKVILMGRLVADPEFSTTQSGVALCRIRIAVDRDFVKQGEERQSDFFRITCWRQTAEFVNRYFVKGKPILVEGKIQNANYTDQNGVKHYQDDIIADTVSFLLSDPTRAGGNNGGYQNNYNNNYGGGYQGNSYPNNNYSNNQNYNNYTNNQNQNYNTNYNNTSYPQGSQPKDISLGNDNLNDFQEIISDGEVPF